MSYLKQALKLRCSEKGTLVREFEQRFARYVGARHGIAHCNGTATLHTALVALGVKPGDRVAVPPLTYASTTLAVLHAGAVPRFVDIAHQTWRMGDFAAAANDPYITAAIPVSLYGLWSGGAGQMTIDDAAETLNRHFQETAFTSYSFEASKILPIGEGGMLVTDDDALAVRARQFHTVGYHVGGPEDERPMLLSRRPDAIRHDVIGWNYQMSDVQAAVGLTQLERADDLKALRLYSAQCYAQAIAGCDWITPQYVPEGWPHSYWCYGIALRDKTMWEPFAKAILAAGGEMPYGAFRLTYQEPAFQHLAPDGTCPVAEDLQPRLMQLQTNYTKPEAERAAAILHSAIKEMGS